MTDICLELMTPKCRAAKAETCVPDSRGYYAIFLAAPGALPPPFLDHISSTGLIYLGIAAKLSLRARLVDQELRSKGPATFFRSIGAILGYKPPIGSLRGQKNTRNYKFDEGTTERIISWINDNLELSWVESSEPDEELESRLIESLTPIINIKHNPRKLEALLELREECRRIACS